MIKSPQLEQTHQITHHWTLAQPVVSAFIVSAVSNTHDADDIIGQVAETIVTKFSEYDFRRPFIPWALGIARQRVLQYCDRRKNERNRFFDGATLDALAQAHQEIAEELSPRLKALASCMEKVRGKGVKVLQLHYIENMKADEIADRMSMSSNAVWVMLHRTREALSNCIEQKLRSERSTY
jgi:RNA polymerase sigma-70 factor (ECF subfamily)